MALLTPDRYFSRISAIDIERDLLGCGLSHVLLDIDNTVRARDTGCVWGCGSAGRGRPG